MASARIHPKSPVPRRRRVPATLAWLSVVAGPWPAAQAQPAADEPAR